MENESFMRENDWTRSIFDILNQENLGENIHVEVFRKLPYAFEIDSFSDEWNVDEYKETFFETDLLIYEQKNNKIIPRVIVESKIESITTHDAITYRHKASYHKNVIPFVRYGIMCGNRGTYPLPGRLFRHGTNFDFLFSFIGIDPNEKEREMFVEMLKKEILYSKQIEEILANSRSKNRKKYFMLQKEIHLEEF